MKRFCMLTIVCILAGALLVMLGGCAPAGNETADGRRVTDLLGRSVKVPQTVERAVCIGAGALRLYSYVGDLEKLAGVEACEYGYLISVRPYQAVNEELFLSLPSVGAGGPQGTPDAEALLAVGVDVIFSTYNSDLSAVEQLQQQTGIPVVVLSYGVTEAFDDAISHSLSLIGEVMGTEERADEVISYLAELEEDLALRTEGIPQETKKTVYLGCQSNYGTHGIGSSTANYSLFNAVGARNVLDEAGYTGYQRALDLETLLALDPDVIILDAGGLSLLKEEYQESKAVFDRLSAFQSGEVYVQMPYNAYYTNLEIAYANAYFIGKVLYPEAFSDVSAAQMLSEISMRLLGEDCCGYVTEAVGEYGKIDVSSLEN